MDYVHLLIFPFAYIISLFYRKRNKNLILICESAMEARDNGYWLFKYICEKYPEQQVAYAINYSSPDYSKVKSLGQCIKFGSFKHWIYYLSANINASSQKDGKPNAAVCYLLEVVLGLLVNKRVFMQHGITINEADWLYYENTRFRTFICGALPEFEAIKRDFGYPADNVEYLGFTRFDQLHDIEVDKRKILLMPSWREWLNTKTDAYYEFGEGQDFVTSEYFLSWNEFLSCSSLIDFLEKHDLELIFYPHRNVQQQLDKFDKRSDRIVFADWIHHDIQDLLIKCAFMVTDYSSVSMDFSYMRKPVVFYQFDQEKFRQGQYGQGYFSYEKDGFGPVITDSPESVVDYIKLMYERNFILEAKYLSKVEAFFPLYDTKNCERTYQYIKTLI